MTTALRPELPPLPDRIKKLPLHRGYPVPWFVAVYDGVPDFRVIGTDKVAIAHNRRLCWICGERLGSYIAFLVGPMCAVNKISSEPPSHRECAEFAVIACPFLTRPHMVRREGGLPEGVREAAGVGLKRNPGVAMVWVTKDYKVQRVDNGVLFVMGAPRSVACYAEGRRATVDEIRESIDSGVPLLMAGADEEKDERHREAGIRALNKAVDVARQLLGAA